MEKTQMHFLSQNTKKKSAIECHMYTLRHATKRATSSMLANSLSRKISIITRSQYGEGHRAASQHTLALGAWDGSGTRRLGLAFPALIVGRFMHTCHGAARSISSALERGIPTQRHFAGTCDGILPTHGLCSRAILAEVL